jgi:hypothetical protein
MFPEEESEKKKTKAVALGKPAAGQCLCGKVAFEIDVPARWAWHDHSPSSRRAHGAAYATYVGSWRKRFRITKGKTSLTRYEDKATKTARSFCASCGTPIDGLSRAADASGLSAANRGPFYFAWGCFRDFVSRPCGVPPMSICAASGTRAWTRRAAMTSLHCARRSSLIMCLHPAG